MPKEIAHTAHRFCASFHEGEALAQLQIDTLCCVVSGTGVSGKPPNGVPGHFPLSDGEEPPANNLCDKRKNIDLLKALFERSLLESLCIECQIDTNHSAISAILTPVIPE
ncbi:TPA: hypothetical protein R8G59_000127 [Citrobacter freundii]|nr:hypothetical protein [Citrobacter freundii]